MEEKQLRKLGKLMSPNYAGRRVARWDPNASHWSYDPAQHNGEVYFTKRGKLGKRRKKRRVIERERKPRAVKQRVAKLIEFKVGDYVLFNPNAEGHPTCVDGTITRIKRCYDRRAQEFIERFTIEQADGAYKWSVTYPGTPIKKVKVKV
jgi:hypothetical protein